MRSNSRSGRIGLLLTLPVIVALPFLLGQGCPGTSNLVPVTPRGTNNTTNTDTTGTGNASPVFAFSEPSADISAQVGQKIRITWTDSDPDNNAAITLLADPDNVLGNGNERVILALVMEDDPTNAFDLDTSSLPDGAYRIIARVNDGVNPELIAVAPGRLLLFTAGLLAGNKAPEITLVAPDTNLSVAQGDALALGYCGHDVDGGFNNVNADVVLLLDTDQDQNNDLDLTSTSAELNFLAACSAGGFPRPVGGVYVLGCAKDDNCVLDPAAPTIPRTTFTMNVDVSQIPPRTNGQPYWPRAIMWDHVNAPVSSYSRGNVSITGLGSGTIDLGDVGHTVTGAKFYGFDAGDLAGSSGATIGDLDGDNADDIVILSRYGNGYGTTGNVGMAHVVMGMNGRKYGNEFSLNAVGTLGLRGSTLTMPGTTGTYGLTSVCRMSDIDGDGHPDLAIGAPYAEILYDALPDDLHHCPCPAPPDTPPGCYGDLMPNPWSVATGAPCTPTPPTPGPVDVMHEYDWREYPLTGCSNDFDLASMTPINGGYTFVISSRNNLQGSPATGGGGTLGQVFDISAMGQGARPGARFRGGWYDLPDMTQTIRPYAIIPDNLFGQTVASAPFMVDSNIDSPPGYGPDLVISSPNAYRGKGAVFYNFTNNYTSTNPGGVQSFPYYVAGGACPGPSRLQIVPPYAVIVGAAVGDNLGYAAPAGDYNLDGNHDLLMGAPGAERGGIAQRGIVYVLFGRPDFPDANIQGALDLQLYNPPRMEIWGINTNDQFGLMQTLVGDVNHDGVPDFGFSSQYFDSPGGIDSGAIYVVFGGRRLTGENVFTVNQVGTAQLPGFKIYGTQPGAHAGAVINNCGDFNGDGTDDMVVNAPDEIRAVNGQNRRGVAYVIFGGPHLNSGTFSLAQVGTNALPGIVLISPFAVGSADEAPIDWISSAGDMNNDGFTDILVGLSAADFVNPLEPSQRRVNSGQMYLIYGSNTGSNKIGS